MRSGQRVGKYVLGEQIGRGGMAEVWSARAEGPGGFVKTLALKFISDSFAGDVDLERLFVNEARVAAQLQHANLVCVFDFDKWSDPASGEGGRYYIAMERVDGQDLRRVLQVARHKGRKLSPALALHIVGEVLKGLRYVHERPEEGGTRPLGLVHRDVSPHNVLVGMGGEVKLSDFGIAKAMSQSLGTQAGTIRGKLAYASPEQLSGEPVDHRADQFALGVTFWEMLAARRLFEGADQMEIVGKVLRCDIPAFSAEVAVDPEVEGVVRRMLARSPAERFPSTGHALTAVMEAPGYLPHAPALTDFMQALFAPRPIALPPTVPLRVPEAPVWGFALAETSALEPPVSQTVSRSDSGATHVNEGLPLEVPEPGTATGGSGYVSVDTPHVPAWIDQPEVDPAPRRRTVPGAVSVIAIGIGVAASLAVARRVISNAPPQPPVADGPRPSANQPIRAAAAARPSPPIPSKMVQTSTARAASSPLAAPPSDERQTAVPQASVDRHPRRHASGRRPTEGEDRRPGQPESPTVSPASASPRKGNAPNGAPILE